MMKSCNLAIVVVSCATLGLGRIFAEEPPQPPSPEEALSKVRLPKGLRLELVAAEPDVQSPVAMAFDEAGRLWVVEMLDYPNGPRPGQAPEGRIGLLEDKHNTGRYRATSVFAEGLLFANGVTPWKKGLIVTAAPAIHLFADTDGDGKADRREKLYEGFATDNPQLRVSHPILGLDNWFYVANGMRGGSVLRSGRDKASPINIGGRDFRFDLIGDRAEAVTGMGQYGNTFDDWGERFVCSNRNHWVHLVLAERYVRRNPLLAVPPAHSDNQGPGGAARIYPLGKQETTAAEHAGSFTAACGVFVYRGQLLPEAYRGSIFTCEPTGNLVHQEVLLPKGATFSGRPATPGVEFLASTDEWFRPVFLTHGPDGALYIVDMCRKVVEHPEWMPPHLRGRGDLLLGKNHGRIWRVVPEDYVRPKSAPLPAEADTPQLVKLLEHKDAWWRVTAQRLLLEQQDPQAEGPLSELVRSSASPLARIHAAWLLEQRQRLTAELVLTLLMHEHPRVREQAVRLSERWLPLSVPLQKRVVELAGDEDERLRFQVALSLGEWDDERILAPLARIATANMADRWTRLAVASAVPDRAGALLCLLAADAEPARTNAAAPLVQELATLVGSRQDHGEVAHVLEAVWALSARDAASLPLAVRRGLAEGLARRGSSLSAFREKLPEKPRSLLDRFNGLMEKSVALARDAKAGTPERSAAVLQLAQVDWKTAGPVLRDILQAKAPPEVRMAAVRALAGFTEPEVGALLLQGWADYPAALKREALEQLVSRPEPALLLLEALAAGRVAQEDLDSLRRTQLLGQRRADIRARARQLLGSSPTSERRKVIDEYQKALKLAGDPTRGSAVFQKASCHTCHRLGSVGVALGPDLSDMRVKSPETLLIDILDPNAAIDGHFVNWVVELKSGKVLTGLVASESASSITLVRGEGQSDVVLRQDIEPGGMVSTHHSLMPEGLEKQITPAEMADLLAYLKRWPELKGR